MNTSEHIKKGLLSDITMKLEIKKETNKKTQNKTRNNKIVSYVQQNKTESNIQTEGIITDTIYENNL